MSEPKVHVVVSPLNTTRVVSWADSWAVGGVVLAGWEEAVNFSGDPQAIEQRDRIQAWLGEEGWTTESLPPDGITWGIKAVSPAKHILAVLQSSGHPDQVVIRAEVNVPEWQRQQLAMLERSVRMTLMWDLYLHLAQMGIVFDGITDPLRRVVVVQRIYADALIKDAFMQRVTQVWGALMVVLGLISRTLGDAPSAKPNELIRH